MKKVIFVNPPLSMEERYGDMAESGTSTPPLGLAILGAVTREKGYTTSIVDAEVLRWSFKRTASEILEVNPDYVGITAVTISIFNAAKLAEILKAKRPDMTIIIGGPHITAVPEETMRRFSHFDIGAIGESEHTILELLDCLDNQGDLNGVNGLILRNGNELEKTGTRKPILEMDTIPFPAWDMLPYLTKYYKTPAFYFGRTPASSLVTSRGCSGRCKFCDRKVFGNRMRGYSADYIIRMIVYLKENYGIRDVMIHDDTFVLLRKRLHEFCNKVIDKEIDITWSCNARVDSVNKEGLKLMKRAGCQQIGYGIESGNQDVLNFIAKGIVLEKVEQAVRWTHDAGIRTRGFFMLGHPTETVDSMRDTIEFAKKIYVDDFQITCFTPLPGSEAYDIAEQFGTFDDDWKKMSMWEPIFIPNGLTKEEIIRFQKLAFREFYFRPRIFWSYLKSLRSGEHVLKLMKGGLSLLKTFRIV